VHITGWASGDEVREQLLAARAMILPSFAEGLPVVIMEALGLGRPVLSTYVAGIPELVVPGENGWLVPAGSVDHLVAALRQVLATPTEKLVQMGEAGRRAVLERHDVRVTAASLASLLRAHA
jgi:colanic acid/amylovoran biosynthesis glycosyltransferase